MVGVRADTGNHLGVTGLYRAQRAAHRDDAARAAERHVVQPSNRDAQVLSDADRGIRRQR